MKEGKSRRAASCEVDATFDFWERRSPFGPFCKHNSSESIRYEGTAGLRGVAEERTGTQRTLWTRDKRSSTGVVMHRDGPCIIGELLSHRRGAGQGRSELRRCWGVESLAKKTGD